MLALSLDQIIAYSDLVLLDTSVLGRNSKLGEKIYRHNAFLELNAMHKEMEALKMSFLELTKKAEEHKKLQIIEEVAREHEQILAHLQNWLSYHQNKKAIFLDKLKSNRRERSVVFKRHVKFAHKKREEVLDYYEGLNPETAKKSHYESNYQKNICLIDSLYKTMLRNLNVLERYAGARVKLPRSREDISQTDYQIIAAALGCLTQGKERKSSVLTWDKHFPIILEDYFKSEQPPNISSGEIRIYLMDGRDMDLNRLHLHEEHTMRFLPDKLIYAIDHCNENGRKVQAKVLPLPEELGHSNQPDSVCSVLRMPEEPAGRGDN